LLAYQAHLANEAWNAGAARWNRRPSRRGRQRGRRSRNGKTIPDEKIDGTFRVRSAR
jgi:hypothetical protein